VTFFLYRPHVLAADGTIVTPDLLVERVDWDGTLLDPARLSMHADATSGNGRWRAATGRIASGEIAIRAEARVFEDRGVVTTIALTREAIADGPADIDPGTLVVRPD